MIAWDADRRERWKDFAACAETSPELFFPEKGGSARQAKRVCRECPVRAQCLASVMAPEDDPGHGIFGGLTARERQSLRLALRRRAA